MRHQPKQPRKLIRIRSAIAAGPVVIDHTSTCVQVSSGSPPYCM